MTECVSPQPCLCDECLDRMFRGGATRVAPAQPTTLVMGGGHGLQPLDLSLLASDLTEVARDMGCGRRPEEATCRLAPHDTCAVCRRRDADQSSLVDDLESLRVGLPVPMPVEPTEVETMFDVETLFEEPPVTIVDEPTVTTFAQPAPAVAVVEAAPEAPAPSGAMHEICAHASAAHTDIADLMASIKALIEVSESMSESRFEELAA